MTDGSGADRGAVLTPWPAPLLWTPDNLKQCEPYGDHDHGLPR